MKNTEIRDERGNIIACEVAPLNINPSTLHACIWMSMRYAIGRHSIASCTHANDLAKLFRDNPDLCDTEVEAKDIRREISDHVGFYHNVHVAGYSDRNDALSLLLDHMIAHKIDDFNRFKFDINLYTGEVVHEPMQPKGNRYGYDWQMAVDDLMPWLRLADYLNPRYRVTIDKVKQLQDDCIKFYQFAHDGTVVEYYCPARWYEQNPSVTSFITPEFITNVEKLQP